VSLSTVFIGNLSTSNAGNLCVGSYSNELFKTVSSEAYFQLSIGSAGSLNNILQSASEPIYDSMSLILYQIGNYGDTTKSRKLDAYRLTDYLQYDNQGYIYSNSSFNYQAAPISNGGYFNGDLREYHITINQSFGEEIFNMAQNNSSSLQSTVALKEYLKGIRVATTDLQNANAAYNYSLNPVLRLYYHESESPEIVQLYDFVHTASDLFYNKIINDRTATALNTLNEDYNEVNASLTNNTAILLDGITLYPKILFPTINNLKNSVSEASIIVNRAELWIYPKRNSYDELFYLPQDLVLYQISESNLVQSIIYYTGTTRTEIENPVLNANGDSYYKFDVTDFMYNRINKTPYGTTGLLLAPITSDARSTINHLEILNNSQDVSLKIYYTKIQD
ncbi:MAG TPA: DUF4270 family protein, partial [Cytophaga sp.]|nr:DUF4270 family protein [Cytophaga sp.]